MKTYFIMLSQRFLSSHPRAGEPTYFAEKFFKGQDLHRAEIDEEFGRLLIPKLHTIRSNYEFWESRVKEVLANKALLSVRVWSGKPFASKQIKLKPMTTSSGVGIQKLIRIEDGHGFVLRDDGSVTAIDLATIARNDGLSLSDFYFWFRNSLPTKESPWAIIHFTPFRY